MKSIIESSQIPLPEPKRPGAGAWVRNGTGQKPPGARGTLPEIYDHVSGMRALTAVEHVQVDAERAQLEYHVSFSCAGRRASREQVRQALSDFGMAGALEDNHVPGGIARNFWLPIDPKVDAGCYCETTEKPHDEGEGYVWRDTPKGDD